MRRRQSGPWAGATLRFGKLGFSTPTRLNSAGDLRPAHKEFGTPPLPVFSAREEEHLRPHGSIDLVEEKPILHLGRCNSSFWESRFFQTYEVAPPKWSSRELVFRSLFSLQIGFRCNSVLRRLAGYLRRETASKANPCGGFPSRRPLFDSLAGSNDSATWSAAKYSTILFLFTQ